MKTVGAQNHCHKQICLQGSMETVLQCWMEGEKESPVNNECTHKHPLIHIHRLSNFQDNSILIRTLGWG